jgi:two-component system cell cycle response regulator
VTLLLRLNAAAAAVPLLEGKLPSARRGDVLVVADKRAAMAEWSAPPILLPVRFGSSAMGQLALAPSRRGASHDDRRLLALLASELGGPLRMAALVAEAQRLASTDTLTGLYNRRAFVERLDNARAMSEKDLVPISFLLLDIDHFKKVNDTFGHEAGDAVLQGVARVLLSMARKSDFVARWGGEEFVIALTQTAEAGARVAAERVRRAVAETRFPLPSGHSHKASASIGLVSADGPGWNLGDLLSRADKAMYNAKNRGRNRVETA